MMPRIHARPTAAPQRPGRFGSLAFCTVTAACAAFLPAVPASAQSIIAVNVADDDNAAASALAASDTAGAPGARTANWNNLSVNASAPTAGQNNLPAGSVNDNSGALLAMTSVTFTPGQNGGGDGSNTNNGGNTGLTNDARFFNAYYDVGANGVAQGSLSGATTVTVTGLPTAFTLSGYSVYAYRFDDGANRAGAFTINTGAVPTLYARGGVGNASTATTYALSSDANAADGVDQGNYVRFDNLTATDFTLSLQALNPLGVTGDNVARNKFVGFEIVQNVPEPGAYAMLAGGLGLLLGLPRLRRRTA